jgi:hypothetical protein
MRRKVTRELVEAQTYPTTSEQVLEAHGDYVLELANGEQRLREVLSVFGEETYESPQDFEDALRCGVGHQAVGRRYYSDRDAFTLAEDGPEQVSF